MTDVYVQCVVCGASLSNPDEETCGPACSAVRVSPCSPSAIRAALRAGSVCRYEDCPEQHPVAQEDDAITCETCRRDLGLDPEPYWGHIDTDYGPEVERDDAWAPPWFTDAHAVLLHRVECGCLRPENCAKPFYGGRTQMPFPTFSAEPDDVSVKEP